MYYEQKKWNNINPNPTNQHIINIIIHLLILFLPFPHAHSDTIAIIINQRRTISDRANNRTPTMDGKKININQMNKY